jgi:hypothetical protein
MGIASEENFDLYRIKALWFGLRPTDLDIKEFEHRNLKVVFLDNNAAALEKELNYSRGIVVKFDRNKPASFKKIILAAPIAINYGVKIFAIYDGSFEYGIVSKTIHDLNLEETIRPQIFTASQVYRIAEDIARHDPGRYFDISLEIKSNEDGSVDKLSSAAKFLLRRAFSDCVSIQIQRIPGGRAATNVLSVHALYKGSLVGLRPLPFFAKIDKQHRVKREMDKYHEFAVHYIPFNLRPNLVKSRCILGFDYGIIVGNFVEQSETLLDAARRGHAQGPIYSLFDNALKGWRTQSKVLQGSIYKKMYIEKNGNFLPFIDSNKITSECLSFAKEFGSKLEPCDLLKKLEEIPEILYQSAPIHGDLHSLNVRVRNHDAILIDFSSTRHGPLLSNYASLEISLAFEVSPLDKDFEGWLDLMDTVYCLTFINKTPPPVKDPHDREWLCACIRQIRILALAEQKSSQEYSTLLAIHLLRQATYPGRTEEEKRRNAYAYVLAEQLINRIGKYL